MNKKVHSEEPGVVKWSHYTTFAKGAITMDKRDYITEKAERKKGQHLQREERGAIQHLKRQGYSNRAIAKEIGCSPSTIANELRRGTLPRTGSRGRKPGYSAKRGEAVYRAHREKSRRQHRVSQCTRFLAWVIRQIKEHRWSLDACVGYARLHNLFPPEEMVCTHTLYNEVWAGHLDLSITELPEAIKRKKRKKSELHEGRHYGKDISQRPKIASLRTEEGHWEGDTVVGKRSGTEAVVLSLLEKKTENYIALQIPGRDSSSVLYAMDLLKNEFGDKFSRVFKTITVDNGPEFSEFSGIETWGTNVYFAHPYTSWERAQNERHNGLFRAFVPKGVSISSLSPEYILTSADELNGRPRKKLGYHTPEELFDSFLDSVYALPG